MGERRKLRGMETLPSWRAFYKRYLAISATEAEMYAMSEVTRTGRFYCMAVSVQLVLEY
jgi:hypothetical protein